MIFKGGFGFGSASAPAWIFQPENGGAKKVSIKPSIQPLTRIFETLKQRLREEKKTLNQAGDYLDFPLAVLDDPELQAELHAQIQAGFSLDEAVENSFALWEKKFLEVEDPYLKLRVHDLIDLRRQILALLHGNEGVEIPRRPFILIAKDIFVTQLLRIRKFPLAGICLEEGNEAAHGVLLAKALGIPVVGKVEGLTRFCKTGDSVFFKDRQVYVNETIREAAPEALRKPVSARPGARLPKGAAVRANVQLPEEFQEAKAQGAMGIGLFRTELLRMSRSMTPVQETVIYREAIRIFLPHPVIFRLADFGSDKPYGNLKWPHEPNPALGWRGLRFLLDEKKILRRQLDSMFRAAGKEKLHLLLPMVRTLDEIRSFLAILKSYKKRFPAKASVGIMIETPSSAYLISRLPKEISFVSLGTNDLLQYFFAVDRIHPTLKANPQDPIFVEFLKEIVLRAKRKKLSLSICGELAADPKTIPTLFKLGIRAYSVSIPKIKNTVAALYKR